MGLRWATGCKKQPLGEEWGTREGGINCYGTPENKQRIPHQPWKPSQSSHPETPGAENRGCSLSEYPQPLGKKLQSGLFHPSPRASNNTYPIYAPHMQQHKSRSPTEPQTRQLCRFATPEIYYSAFIIRCGLAEEWLQWLLIFSSFITTYALPHELVQLYKTLAFGVYKGKNQEIRVSHLIIRLNFNKMNRKPD